MTIQTTRTLGTWESLHHVLHERANGHGLIVAVARVEGIFDSIALKQALQKLFHIHPLLHSTIDLNNNRFYFKTNAKFEHIPIRFIQDADEKQWQALFESELNTPLDCHHYLWRVSCLTSHSATQTNTDIVFSISHAIADGMAVMQFFEQLIAHYDHADSEIITTSLPPPIENSLNLKCNNNDYQFEDVVSQSNDWPFSVNTPIEQRLTHYVTTSVDIELLMMLKQKCSQHNVSIHAALSAAMILAAKQLNQTIPAITLCTPINLRPYCVDRSIKENIACYTGMLSNTLSYSNCIPNVWHLAQQYRHSLKHALKNKTYKPPNLDLPTITHFIEGFHLAERNHFTLDLGISNLGKIPAHSILSKQKIKFVYGCPARQAADFALFMSTIELNGELFCLLSYSHPQLSDQSASSFAHYFLEYLKAA